MDSNDDFLRGRNIVVIVQLDEEKMQMRRLVLIEQDSYSVCATMDCNDDFSRSRKLLVIVQFNELHYGEEERVGNFSRRYLWEKLAVQKLPS